MHPEQSAKVGPPVPAAAVGGTERYRVLRVASPACAGVCAVAGGLLGLFPGLVAAILLLVLLGQAAATLTSWSRVRLPINLPVGQPPTVDFVDLLNLSGLRDTVLAWSNAGPLVWLLVVLAFAVCGAVLGALVGLLAAVIYNAGALGRGGMVVEVERAEPGRL